MRRKARLLASICLSALLSSVLGQESQCPLPTSLLLRRDDLATCSAGDRPPPLEPAKSAEAQKESSLPSFDEWKEKHAEEEQKKQGKKPKVRAAEDGVPVADAAESPVVDTSTVEGALPASDSLPPEETPTVVPEVLAEEAIVSLATTSYVHPLPGDPEEVLLPLRSRTNYASQDCAASVLRSSKDSKHASSVLNSKKDRYMLTPCNADPKYVIVELCEEIDIDTVVLANWEFFSSMFKLFRASVSEVYPGRPEDWRELGVFRAGNMRGSQVFKPRRSGGFYRYMRLDFLTHYGTEYYCPVSLLEVYGRTQMESYRDEERAKDEAMRRAQALLLTEETSEDESNEALEGDIPLEASPSSETVEEATKTSNEAGSASAVTPASETSSPPALPTSLSSNARETSFAPDMPTIVNATVPRATEIASSLGTVSASPLQSSPTAIPAPVTQSSAEAVRNASSSDDAALSSSTSVTMSHSPATAPDSASNATTEDMSASATAVLSNGVSSAANGTRSRNETRSATAPASSATVASGESIYGTIMKRLNALEANATLGFKYIEEQRKLISASILKIEKQFAAAEISRKQDSQLIRRLILDFDLHRAKLEEERQALAAQVTVLANEIVFERRLGLAQLLALLVVLAFVALTRGSSVPLMNLPAPRPRFMQGPADLLRHKSLDRPRRAHTSLPPEKVITPRATPTLPRTPVQPFKRNIASAFSGSRNHRRTRSLTPETSDLTLSPGSRVLSSPLSDRWVSSDDSEAEDIETTRFQPALSVDTATPIKAYPPTPSPTPSVTSPPDATTPTLADALRPITLNT